MTDYYNIKKFKKKKTKIILNSKNLGAGKSRNKGLKISKGKYIAFIDSDDLWLKNKIKTQVNLMEKKNLYFTHCSYKIIDSKNNVIGFRRAKKILEHQTLLKSCDIGLSTVMINKKKICNISFPNIKTKEDFVLWLKISKKFKIFGIKSSLVKWRKLNNSLSSSEIQKLRDGFWVYKKFMKFSYFKSLIFLLILSINFLKKNFIR